jgi:hypothetical protein
MVQKSMNSCGKATGPDPDLCVCRKSRDRRSALIWNGYIAWSIASSCVERERRFRLRSSVVFVCRQSSCPFSITSLLQALRLVISYSGSLSCTHSHTGPTTHGFPFYIIDILHVNIDSNPTITTHIHPPWRDRTAKTSAAWARMATPHTVHGR